MLKDPQEFFSCTVENDVLEVFASEAFFFAVDEDTRLALVSHLLNEDEKRVIELALRHFRGTIDECLDDEALVPEEREAFEEDAKVMSKLLDE